MIQAQSHRWLRIGGFTALLLLGVWLFVPDALAQLAVPITGDVDINSSIVTDKTFGDAVLAIVNYFIGFLGFLATIVFVYAGALWILNGGNEDLITKAKKMMMYAAMGIVVVILSFTIVTFIAGSAGSQCLKDEQCATGQICITEDEDGDGEPDSGVCRAQGSTTTEVGECLYQTDCDPSQWCVYNKEVKEYQCTENEQNLLDLECLNSAQCTGGLTCYQSECVDPASIDDPDIECFFTPDCFEDGLFTGEVCSNNVCQLPPNKPGAPFECFHSFHCDVGEYCLVGKCQKGNDLTCTSSEDCSAPKVCDDFGFCRNPKAGLDNACSDNTDCPSGFVCNAKSKHCAYQGSGNLGGNADGSGSTSGETVTSDTTQSASAQTITEMDEAIQELNNVFGKGIAEDINKLPEEDKDQIKTILGEGSLADKMGQVQDMLDTTDDPLATQVLERILKGLEQLLFLREELDELRDEMPESVDTIAAWDETSEALDDLIDDPDSSIKLRRFETKYRNLTDLIRQFPVVQARITATPGEGNVPLTVTLDGLNSIDPTGGTISDYRWTFLDNHGNEVSLGNDPVIVHEFMEPNTYSVRLTAGTSLTDSQGYKTASDGVATVRIKVNPPTSKVDFRINGAEVQDVYTVTENEAQAGILFDPSSTVPALGRIIQKYEWFFGDGASEERTTPTTVIHTYDKPGDYFVKLVTTDNHNIKDKKVVKLFVKSLAADIQVTPKEGNVNTEFHFKGVSSRSDDGIIRTYTWVVENQEGQTVRTSEEESFFHQFDRPGTYKVILSVADITGASDNTFKMLKIISRSPVARFQYSTPQSNHPNTIEFNAIGSYDLDEGDILTYSWDFDGDGTFEIVDSTEVITSHEYKKVGDYRVRLQVEDQFGQRDLAEKKVSIDSLLSGDIFLKKRAVHVGEEIEFRINSEKATSYLWEFGDGETESTEDDEVTHTYKKKSRYNVTVHFFDDEDNENTDSVTMLIGNADEPLAVIQHLVNGREQKITEDLCGNEKDGVAVTRADSVTFSGRDSINTDGSSRLLNYDWRISDGNRSSKKEFTHKFDELSESGKCFEVELVVRDEISGKLSDADTVLIKVVNQLPTLTDFAIEGARGEQAITPLKVRLRVVNPKDADGSVKRYRWWHYREGRADERLGMHTTTIPETDMIITAQGQAGVKNKYFFVAELTDTDGGVMTTEERFGEVSYLEVENGPNLSPVAEFTVDKTTISAGDSITFVSQAYDPQGDILPNDAYKWDFDGDGAFDDTGSGAQASRQFNTPGEYDVRLKVTHRGLSTSVNKTIFVQPTQSLPQAAFTYKVDGNTVAFDANNSRFDPDLSDTTLRFEWDFNVAEDANGNGVSDDDVESTEVTPSFTYSTTASYRVRLKVKDSLGMEGVVVRAVDLNLSEVQRERDTYHSLRVQSPDQPLAFLNFSIRPVRMSKGGTADVIVNVTNADNSVYLGEVFFEVIEGSGEFTPNPIQAENGRAGSIFTATETGTVRVRMRATGTDYGELTEEATINVFP